MCSITEQVQAAVTPTVPASSLSVLAAHARELTELVADLLRDSSAGASSGAVPGDGAVTGSVDLGGLHPDVAAELATTLLAAADRAMAAATVLAGQVVATTGPGTGCLIAGRYASARRWLEVDACLAPAHAKAVLARARDLRDHSTRVEDAWLAGHVSGDTVRELTSGVTGVLKPVAVPAAEKQRMREEALDLLLPLAEVGTPADVHTAVDRLRFTLDPDTTPAEQALAAYDEQTLTVSVLGAMTRITAWLTHENAAAALTVLDHAARHIADQDRPVTHLDDCPGMSSEPACTCGARASAGAVSKNRWSHLLAVAFSETMTSLLDNGLVGSHHGVAPHVTLTTDLDHYLHALTTGTSTRGTLVGELTMPGHDDTILLPDASVRRILCDADLTHILTGPLPISSAAGTAAGSDPTGTANCSGDARSRLLTASREVLYVGRAQRTATPRQRRALETRDRHCVFPSCRAHPRRCQAHHVTPWEEDGPTDIPNLALLCVRHHHAVHEGGWTLHLKTGYTGHEHDCWQFTPP